MIEILSFDFMRHALLAAVMASVACGVIGSLVVVNRLVFLAGGVAHAAYGGVGLALFLGLPILLCTVGFTMAAAMAMAWVTISRRGRSDTMIGVLWAAGMAFGILLLDMSPGYNVDLMSYLFGSILAVPAGDLMLMGGLLLLILTVVGLFYNQLLAMSLDREFCRSRGLRAGLLHTLLLALVAVTVVMVIRVVGLILVIALLTIPCYLAERITSSLGRMMLASALLSIGFCLLGLLAAFQLDLTSGASIIGVATVAFLAFMAWEGYARTKDRGEQRDEAEVVTGAAHGAVRPRAHGQPASGS
jgi:zinc transport system permease protein